MVDVTVRVSVRSRKLRRFEVTALPFAVRVYINNQVLVPASLVRALGIAHLRFADVDLEYKGFVIELRGVRLLRTRHTDARQFTIPKRVRETYGVGFGDVVKILSIRPSITNKD
ncbi:MAG: AbrB/MazE/SpoVT family DNA-binding domain-containing protein [Vulcanisaeta sp.]|nr:AbrB/MazE/SpoVT family DNA-binding domain-containing protein [Vulcanisaeta sp.]